jgi:hypothetical protein
MLGKLFKVGMVVVFIGWLMWHYRDAAVVREHHALIESVLVKAGVEPGTVHRYWPLEDAAANAPSQSPSPAPGPVLSAWNDFLARYNLVNLLRERKSAMDESQPPGDGAQKRSTTP